MIGSLLRYIPGQPPVDVHTNTKGIFAWFTPEHIGGLIALALVVIFVRVFWKMLMGHPVIFLVLALLVAVILGWIQFGHIPGGGTGQHPLGPPR